MGNTKKPYSAPIALVIRIDAEDIIRTSKLFGEEVIEYDEIIFE